MEAYQRSGGRKSDLERTELAKTKTGVFTGAYAINPVNGEQIPIWIADYVLTSYGTGAIMAVPGHDERDFEFAKQFDLPIVTVVHAERRVAEEDRQHARRPEGGVLPRTASRSTPGMLDGLPTAEAQAKIIGMAGEREASGTPQVNYKLRDWLFSRQRYWGEPFPILHELDANGKPTGVIAPCRRASCR